MKKDLFSIFILSVGIGLILLSFIDAELSLLPGVALVTFAIVGKIIT